MNKLYFRDLMALMYFFRLQAKKTSSNEVWDEINTINLLEKYSILVYTYINFMKWEEYYEK